MKHPNGFGSIEKLSGKRRNPYMVRLTVGWDSTGKRLRQTLGYFHTKTEALEALANYHADPYDLSAQSLTFSQVYDKWSAEYFPTLANPSSIRTITAAYKHCSGLYDIPFKNLRVMHLEETIKTANVGDNTKSRIKSMFNMLFRYAMKHDICDKDYAALCNTVKVKSAEHHRSFTDAEIAMLEALQHPFVDMVIINIYSGWRPQELALLRVSDVDLDNMIMKGGMKTEAGKDRIVPIHPHILPLIQKRLEHNTSEFLFLDEEGKPLTYDKYRGRFRKVMEKAGIKDQSPHGSRATFVTLAKRYKVDEYMLKRIAGHSIKDITEEVYTTRTIEQFREEINKIVPIGV